MTPDSFREQARGHRYFAAECFNRAWTLIDKPDRTAAENEQMFLLSLASLWHWTQRQDCTPRNLSIGYWQVARVCALLGQGSTAAYYAGRCLESSAREPPFYLAYAHEALARAALVDRDLPRLQDHLAQALALTAQVDDPDERAMLEKDLAELRDSAAG